MLKIDPSIAPTNYSPQLPNKTNPLTIGQEALSKQESRATVNLRDKKVKQVTSTCSLLKPWEIIICSITVIGLLVLLGLYLGRKQAPTTENLSSLTPILPLNENALRLQKEIIIKSHKNWYKFEKKLKNFSLEDQVLILQLMELYPMGIDLDPIEREVGITVSAKTFPSISKNQLQSLLEIKPVIAKALASIKTLELKKRIWSRIPDAIGLLVNVERIVFRENEMKNPPNLRHNIHLKELIITGNNLQDPPNLQMNTALEMLDLSGNGLKTPPDVSKNPNLEALYLQENEITIPPELEHNPQLQSLKLYSNLLKQPPKVDCNPQLLCLDVCSNELESPPDVTNNKLLRELILDENQITSSPDISNNTELKFFNMNVNQLASLPDFSKNLKIEVVRATGNKISKTPNLNEKNSKLHTLCLGQNLLDPTAKAEIKKSVGSLPTLEL